MASSSAPSIGGLSFSSSSDQQGLEEVQLAWVDAHRIEGAVVQRAHLDVLDAGPRQRLDGALAGPRRALGPDVAVILVLDLQHVARKLPVFVVTPAHPAPRMARCGCTDRAPQVAQVLLEAVDRHRDLGRLVAVAVADVAHAQRGRMRTDQRIGRPVAVRLRVAATLQERAAQRRRSTEQVGHEPAVPAVVAQQVEIARRDEIAGRDRAYWPELGIQRPEGLRQRVIEMHARDGLHHAAVADLQSVPVDVLDPALVRGTVVRNRNLPVAANLARHGGCPEQFLAQVAIDELMQVAQVVAPATRCRERSA